MIRTETNDENLAYGLLRAVAGMNLLMHGLSRWLVGPAVFASKLMEQFAKTPLPEWSVRAFGLILPTIEALLGVLLLIGLRPGRARGRRPADDGRDVRIVADTGLERCRNSVDICARVVDSAVFATVQRMGPRYLVSSTKRLKTDNKPWASPSKLTAETL